jgi:hypothetical protein
LRIGVGPGVINRRPFISVLRLIRLVLTTVESPLLSKRFATHKVCVLKSISVPNNIVDVGESNSILGLNLTWGGASLLSSVGFNCLPTHGAILVCNDGSYPRLKVDSIATQKAI